MEGGRGGRHRAVVLGGMVVGLDCVVMVVGAVGGTVAGGGADGGTVTSGEGALTGVDGSLVVVLEVVVVVGIVATGAEMTPL